MLHALAATRAAHRGELRVVSLDHGLRPEAIAEVAQVGRQAGALGLPFTARRLDLSPGPGLQARARAARRAALLAVADELGASRVATAHHQDDQAETVLQRLLAGAGSRGLRAMLPLEAPWCRPLLDEPRAVLQAWAELEQLSWVEDPSNAGSQRGRIRELVGQLDALHGGANAALARSARLLARDEALLGGLTEARFEALRTPEGALPWQALRAEPEALVLRLVRRLCEGRVAPPRADQLERLLRWKPEEGGRIELAGGAALVFRGAALWLEPGDLGYGDMRVDEE